MIQVQHAVKHYRVHSRSSGLRAAVKSLWRRDYKTVKAVNDISFTIEPGERVGFLGPNGAGKTTTLKMLAGLLHPTSGGIRVLDFIPQQRQVSFLSSIMLVAGQKSQLLWDLPPVDTFELNRAIYDIPLTAYQGRIAELTQLLEIEDVIRKPTRQLSLGERMKCELASALLHQPKILFLDEPTIGIDVTMQATVRNFIRTYNERHGAVVLLTSHNMDDVAHLCDRVIIIDKGTLAFDGSLKELVRSTRPEKRLTLLFSAPVEREKLDHLGRVVFFESQKAVLQIAQQNLGRAITTAVAELPVHDLNAEDAPLEEVLADVFARSRALGAGISS